MKPLRIAGIARTCAVVAALLGPPVADSAGDAAPESAPAAQVERGRYLAAAANCAGCHTRSGGRPFAGGVPLATPFGTLYSTNITPDAATGLGTWTQAQFVAALRTGVRADGSHLYPAFPYTSFTAITDADADALWAFLRTLDPVSYRAPENDLKFPFGQRWLLGAWKSLYFEEGRFRPDAARSAEWNRGAYLVTGPGHCGACHTPRNFLGAEDAERALTGGVLRHSSGERTLTWSATNLTPAAGGLGSWSVEELVDYLKYGYSARASVFGPMNDVVLNSTRHLSDGDLRAMAVYLKSLTPAQPPAGATPAERTMSDGDLLYTTHCGTCHLPTGLGSESTGPPLLGSSVTLAADPASLINVVLHGPDLPRPAPSTQWQERRWQEMEPYAGVLSDEEAAALLTYVRNSWGNRAGIVVPKQVAERR